MIEWISIKKDLPKINEHNESEDVLVSTDRYGILVAHLNFYQKGGHRKEDAYSWTEKCTGCGCCSEGVNPTHWAYLPESPKEDQ